MKLFSLLYLQKNYAHFQSLIIHYFAKFQRQGKSYYAIKSMLYYKNVGVIITYAMWIAWEINTIITFITHEMYNSTCYDIIPIVTHSSVRFQCRTLAYCTSSSLERTFWSSLCFHIKTTSFQKILIAILHKRKWITVHDFNTRNSGKPILSALSSFSHG